MLNDAQKTALTTLFQGDRYSSLVAAGSDGTLADLANEKRNTAQAGMKPSLAKKFCLLQGIYPVFFAGRTNADPQIAGICVSAIALLDGSDDIAFDPTYPAVAGMLQGLKTAQMITQDQINALASLGSIQVSDVEQLPTFGVGATVSVDDISSLYDASRVAAYNTAQAAIAAKAEELRAQFPEASEIELLERADQILHGADWGHS